jgi:hypothetical protein
LAAATAKYVMTPGLTVKIPVCGPMASTRMTSGTGALAAESSKVLTPGWLGAGTGIVTAELELHVRGSELSGRREAHGENPPVGGLYVGRRVRRSGDRERSGIQVWYTNPAGMG